MDRENKKIKIHYKKTKIEYEIQDNDQFEDLKNFCMIQFKLKSFDEYYLSKNVNFEIIKK